MLTPAELQAIEVRVERGQKPRTRGNEWVTPGAIDLEGCTFLLLLAVALLAGAWRLACLTSP